MSQWAGNERHARLTIVLHWTTVLLVVLLWSIGQTIDFAPRGALRVDYRSLHMLLGVTLAVVLLIRLIWRAVWGGMLEPLVRGWQRAPARIVHTLLYVLLVSTVTLGVIYAWARGDSVFNLFTIPQLHPGDRTFIDTIGERHALFANLVLILAGLHAAAALFHHFVWRDAVLRRMLPWR